jgi:PAS domain S-box-containing protein
MNEPHYLETELTDLVQASSEMWDFLQRGSLDGCWYWDLEKPENEWMSPEFWRLFGIDPDTRRHDPAEWQDLIFPEDRDIAIENFQKHLADPDHPYDQTVRYRHADGSTVWVRCRGIAIRNEQGKPIRMLGAHNDLTAAKRAEAQANEERRTLQTLNDELREFSYSISHDMRSPSGTLKMLIDELELSLGERLDDDSRYLIKLSRDTLTRMQDRIDAVLRYSRLVGASVSMRSVDVNSVIKDVVADLAGEHASSNATIELDDLPEVFGDAPSLALLFQNLISNAIKFSSRADKPRIRITAAPGTAPSRVRISVSDNGIGIAQDDQQRIFEIFGRLNLESEYPGHGVGLAVCRRIARSHGGALTVESEPGAGSTFSVSLSVA